jgi:hypothetical protein
MYLYVCTQNIIFKKINVVKFTTKTHSFHTTEISVWIQEYVMKLLGTFIIVTKWTIYRLPHSRICAYTLQTIHLFFWAGGNVQR